MKQLGDFVAALQTHGLLITAPAENPAIAQVSYSSQSVEAGTLFVCKGAAFKEQYLLDAAQKGAVAYVSQVVYDVDLPCVLVSSALDALSICAQLHFDYPASKLTLVSVTGTKGKSTTCCYIKSILDGYLAQKGEQPAAIISSVYMDDGVTAFVPRMTTPESLDLQRHLHNAVQSGRTYCVCETSSQAFKYGRVFGMHFDATAFLNIGEDHISPIEHPNFEDYFTSKLKIFAQSGFCSYNLGCDHLERIETVSRETSCNSPTFGLMPAADFYGYSVQSNGLGIDFKVKCRDFDACFSIGMPGLFNVENALAAISICHHLGIPVACMQEGLKTARAGGRMEVFASHDRHKIVIVDFAHNYMSFLKIYESVEQEYAGRQIVTVFGCPGGKALDRRRDMGMVSGIHSHRIYITEDDPGNESVDAISQEIYSYASRNCDDVLLVYDRPEAIRRAIFDSSDNAVILVLGKGRESNQRRGNGFVDCPTDMEFAQGFLAIYDQSPKGIRV